MTGSVTVRRAGLAALAELDRWHSYAGLTAPTDTVEFLTEGVRSGSLGRAVRGSGSAEAVQRLFRQRAVMQACIETTVAVVAYEDDLPVGFAFAGPSLWMVEAILGAGGDAVLAAQIYMAAAAKLHLVAVDPGHRRAGVARKLIRALDARYSVAQYRVMYGQFDATARLGRFYTAEGFTLCAVGQPLDVGAAIGMQPRIVVAVPEKAEVMFGRHLD